MTAHYIVLWVVSLQMVSYTMGCVVTNDNGLCRYKWYHVLTNNNGLYRYK